MKSGELRPLLPAVQLLDVRLADDYEAEHLEGAVSNCVFEVDFIDRLSDTAPEKGKATVVYGASDESREAEMAAEKLKRVGYSDVRILEGGIDGVGDEIDLIEGEPLPEEPKVPDGEIALDLEECEVSWIGRNLINSHRGTVGIKSGELRMNRGALVSGEIVLDMTALKCRDLEGRPGHDVLIGHLKNDDFFDTDHFPEAKVDLLKLKEGGLTATLTMKGETHLIEFPIAAGVTPEGRLAAQATLSIDRTRWGVLYGSKKFFARLAGHLVNDLIDLELRILTVKTSDRS